MFELKFDLSDVEAKARGLGAAIDQMPFAMSLTLNTAARNTYEVLTRETWPRSVTVRNSAFIRRALTVDYSTKQSLRIEIFDKLGRASLFLHAFGGVKNARQGNLAIPARGSPPRESRGARGVRKGLRPAAIIAKTPKRALRITPRGIFVGKGGALQLQYIFRHAVMQKADVPFVEDFKATMRTELRTTLISAVKRAMATRRPR